MSDAKHEIASDAAKSARPPGNEKSGPLGIIGCLAGDGGMSEMLTNRHVALDNCTDKSIFMNKNLIKSIKKSDHKWILTGHKKGVELELDQQGTFMGVEVLYSRGASCNVLCQFDLEEKYLCRTIPGICVRVFVEGKNYDFVARGKRYVLDTKKTEVLDDFDEKWSDYLSTLSATNTEALRCNFTRGKNKRTLGDGLVETVAQNAAQYTIQEQERAAEARDLI